MKPTKLILGIIVFVLLSACSSTSQTSDKTSSSKSQSSVTSRRAICDTPPSIIKRVPPIYPEKAKEAGIEGDIYLNVEVLSSGKVGVIEVKLSLMPGPGGLDEAAVKAVKQWEFTPGKNQGIAVGCWITFPISFSLK